MNLNKVKDAMHCGEEFEICIEGQNYFLQPDYNCEDEDFGYSHTVVYYLNNDSRSKKIFSGTIDEVVNYKFLEKYSLKDDLSKFEFNPDCYIG